MVIRTLRILVCVASLLSHGAALGGPVRAGDHQAFWLWAGVRPKPALAQANRVYLLEGEVLARASARMEARRSATPHVVGPLLWLVVRTDTLAWQPDTYAQVMRTLVDWRAAGNVVEGLEIDFDAGTRGLAGYVAFLRDLRARLPANLHLGVTGLLDWSANGDPADLDALAGTVDEVVFQTYQGRRVIPDCSAYLAHLRHIHIAFRIGILEGADWAPPRLLKSNAFYRGTVMFLRNDVK